MDISTIDIAVSRVKSIVGLKAKSMESVGLYLSNLVYSHGQLYIALSRVKSIVSLKVLILDAEKGQQTQQQMLSMWRLSKISR